MTKDLSEVIEEAKRQPEDEDTDCDTSWLVGYNGGLEKGAQLAAREMMEKLSGMRDKMWNFQEIETQMRKFAGKLLERN